MEHPLYNHHSNVNLRSKNTEHFHQVNHSTNPMVAYSIKDLESLSGVKAHTLRIWEKRYGIIKPNRTETNIRYYQDTDLQAILNISLLNRKGIKISKIAEMSSCQIKQKVAEVTNVGSFFEDQLDALMLSMFDLDEPKFNFILDHQITSKGFEDTMEMIIYPLLDKLGTMWVAGCIKGVHETFVCHCIRKKIIVEIDKLSRSCKPLDIKCLIYLPEQETQELSLLFMEYILLKSNLKVVNLGVSVSLIDILEGKKIFKADYIFTLFNDNRNNETLQDYINELAKNAPDQKIIISGYQTISQKLLQPTNVSLLPGMHQIKEFIHQIVHQHRSKEDSIK